MKKGITARELKQFCETKMKKGYAVMQKKLHELETHLSNVLKSSEDAPPLPAGWHQLLSDGIQQRFLFLNNLLAAEMSSSKPHHREHLDHIRLTLDQFHTRFREWKESFMTDDNNNNDNSTTSLVVGDGDSVCTCDEPYIDDDDDDEDYDDREAVREKYSALGFKVYDVPAMMIKDDDDNDEEEYKNKKKKKNTSSRCSSSSSWKYIGAVGGGAVFGAITTMAAIIIMPLFNSDHLHHHHPFINFMGYHFPLIPT